jgi:hypothetical protein
MSISIEDRIDTKLHHYLAGMRMPRGAGVILMLSQECFAELIRSDSLSIKEVRSKETKVCNYRGMKVIPIAACSDYINFEVDEEPDSKTPPLFISMDDSAFTRFLAERQATRDQEGTIEMLIEIIQKLKPDFPFREIYDRHLELGGRGEIIIHHILMPSLN